MTREIADCITKISAIQFKFGDYLQAIELETKAIVLYERLLGLDNPVVAQCYQTLAMYYHTVGYQSKGYEYMYRAIHIMKIVAGDDHPEIANLYANLGLMYQETDNGEAAAECFGINLKHTLAMFGENSLQAASSY